jgi:hypothetical protein
MTDLSRNEITWLFAAVVVIPARAPKNFWLGLKQLIAKTGA